MKTLKQTLVLLLYLVSLIASNLAQAEPAFTGKWTLHYDWDCDGTYSTAPITFFGNKTFSSEGYTGKWRLTSHELMFQYPLLGTDTGATTYSGIRASRSVTGTSATFWNGLVGCFYLDQAPITTTSTLTLTPSQSEKRDSLGNLIR